MDNNKLPNPRFKDELLEVLTLAAKDKKFLDDFLKDLLAPAEYRELIVRWQILKQLERGTSQRQICQDLKASITTVTRGSHVLENHAGGANQMLRKLVARK